MTAIDTMQILEEVQRSRVREDLVMMAVEVRLLTAAIDERRSHIQDRLALAIEYRSILILSYQLYLARLERVLSRHQETYTAIMATLEVVDHGSFRELRQSISFLRSDTWHWFGFNSGHLPSRIRNRADDALLHIT